MERDQGKPIEQYTREMQFWARPHFAQATQRKVDNLKRFATQAEDQMQRSVDHTVSLNIGTERQPVELQMDPEKLAKWSRVIASESRLIEFAKEEVVLKEPDLEEFRS